MRIWGWIVCASLACGGSNGGDDVGVDAGAVDGATDSARDAAIDTALDSAVDVRVDSGARRVVGFGDEEPPETELEPGSDADHAYRYCWYLTRILCTSGHACCADLIMLAGILGEDVDECIEQAEPAICDVYVQRPDAFGPQDVDMLERNLEELRDASLACEEPTGAKFGFLFGDLPLGGDCSAPAGAEPLNNPNFLCAQGRPCIDDACTEFPDVGESCEYPAYCDFDVAACNDDLVCVEWGDLPMGATCTADYECISKRCRADVCALPADTWCFGAD